MLPYLHVDPIHLGPLTFHAFGLLVATGVLIGVNLAVRRAKRLGYDVVQLQSFITWILVGGFFCAHALDVIFYHPDELAKRPYALFLVWESLSSFGGFIGAVIGAVAWSRLKIVKGKGLVRRAKPVPLAPYCDAIVAVFPVSWVFGRTGCSIVHDHPGAVAQTPNWLTVAYPAFSGEGPRTRFGIFEVVHGSLPRWDLGLLEMLYTVLIVAVVSFFWHRKTPVGFYIATVSLLYAPVRFVMDFVRIHEGSGADLRYGQLTFAQWSCVALFVFGLVVAAQAKKHALDEVPESLLERASSNDEPPADEPPADEVEAG